MASLQLFFRAPGLDFCRVSAKKMGGRDTPTHLPTHILKKADKSLPHTENARSSLVSALVGRHIRRGLLSKMKFDIAALWEVKDPPTADRIINRHSAVRNSAFQPPPILLFDRRY